MLGMAVRSVQLMVDRGELEAWKTPGGHRRISRRSLDAWIARRSRRAGQDSADANGTQVQGAGARTGPCILLIEDSAHYQNLVSLLIRQSLPQSELHVADDGIAGLAIAGKLDPDLLIVDILLPGIDGAALITSLRSHAQFKRTSLIVITSLDEHQREPYAFALQSLPVVHKSRLVAEMPRLLDRWNSMAAQAPLG
jgi:excisionase family DNA binding protein